MNVFVYDGSFEGLLSGVFEAYARKLFPDLLLTPADAMPLFCDAKVEVPTDAGRAERVWRGLQKRLSHSALGMIAAAWLSEESGVAMCLFRYMRKVIDAPRSVETDFGDKEVLQTLHIARKVLQESQRVIQFVRFQKMADGMFFAPIEPKYNVLPLTIHHFKDRFVDQQWLLYDLRRKYGYLYDLHEVREVSPEEENELPADGRVDASLLAADEQLLQTMWKEYFRTIAIKERLNPRLHKRNLPVRFWKHLTEKR